MSLDVQAPLPVDRGADLRSCRACGAADPAPLLDPVSVPLYCNVLWPDRAAAVGAPRGTLRLSECRVCGHVDNQAFQPELLDYTPAYDNSLHFSGHFSGYAAELATRLIGQFGLRDRFVVDVGCGGGDFLALLCRLGGNEGRGYDRACPAEAPAGVRLTFVPEFFSPAEDLRPIDLLCCRQVLEHVDRPEAFLRDIRSARAVTGDTVLFFEVPNGGHTFRGDGVWDMIYEHCSYFSEASLVALFERCGFAVQAVYPLFSGQYLGLEARVADPAGEAGVRVEAPGAAAGFSGAYHGCVEAWRARMAAWAEAGESAVIWGAGSKGVSFLDILRPDGLAFAVDLNPRKQGRFLPGSGVEVVAPERLRAIRPDRVILMNPVYRAEVAERLAALGLTPEIVSA